MSTPDRVELTKTQQKVARAVFEAGCIRFGQFTLASERSSPIYVNLRLLRSFPLQKRIVVSEYKRLLKPLEFDLLADVPTAATPIVSSLTDRFLQDKLIKPQITPRHDAKAYGSGNVIDGVFQKGQVAVLIDDLITTAASKLRAIGILEEAELVVHDVVVLVDRDEGGKEELKQRRYRLHASMTLPEMARFYRSKYPNLASEALVSQTIAALAEAKRQALARMQNV